MKKRAVLFDLDGVITNGWHARPEKRVEWSSNIHQDMGVHKKDLETFFLGGIFEKEVLTGRKTLSEAFEDFLPLHGYTGAVSDFIDYWMVHDSNIKEELIGVVERLKATGEVRLFIATNNEHVRANYMWETVGLKKYFNDIFFAADFSVLKPDPVFYQKCEERIGDLGPMPPLFFDDYPAYVESARACGWEAIVFNEMEDCTNHPFIAGLLSGD